MSTFGLILVCLYEQRIYKSNRIYYNPDDRLREKTALGRPLSLSWLMEGTMAKLQRYLTKEGQKRLQDELSELKAVRRPNVASRIHEATEAGGIVDNAEYEEVKNEQAFIEGRIRDIEQILSDSIVPSNQKDSKGTVQVGSSVTVVDKARKRTVYKLVGSAEAKPIEGKISNESPVGQALMNHKAGDVVEVSTPAGVSELRITKVS